MLERDEIGVAAAVLRRRGRRAASPLALEAVWLVRPTTSATHHRQRRHSCIAAPRGDGQGSARSAGNEAPAAARGPHGPRAVRRSWPEKREVAVSGGRGRAMGPRWAQRERLAEVGELSTSVTSTPPLSCPRRLHPNGRVGPAIGKASTCMRISRDLRTTGPPPGHWESEHMHAHLARSLNGRAAARPLRKASTCMRISRDL